MRLKWLWAIWLASAVTGCGQGHLVFNVDVLSFLSGAGTMPYDLPGGVGPVDSTVSRFFPLRSEEHTSELQSQSNLVCRLLLEKKKHHQTVNQHSTKRYD